jgi:hypothetical protein
MPKQSCVSLPALFSFLLVAALAVLPASAQNEGGADITGNITDRDNTRVYGTVYDPDGNPIPKVDVWVTNDRAPANRQRVKSRPTGSYQVRDVTRLYTQDDIYGIVLRLRFEAPGMQTQEIKVPVEKNSLAEIFPILWPEGADPSASDGWCVIVKGTVKNAKGKPVKNAVVRVTSPDDPELAVEVTAGKKGDYEALLWNAPSSLLVHATGSDGATAEEKLDLGGEKRTDLVAMIPQDLSIGG